VNQKKDEVNLDCFKQIVFDQASHTYTINGESTSKYSVTGAINKFKPKFDADKWANIKAKKEGITPEEIKFRWQEKALFATTFGTCVHKLIESVYLKQDMSLPSNEFIVDILGDDKLLQFKKKLLNSTEGFCNFYKNTKNTIVPVCNELTVGDLKNSKVCGTLDMLAYNTCTKLYELYDFKTNGNISYNSNYKEHYFSPLQHLQVCEFNTYSLQLSIYRYIIEKYTSIKIDSCYILWLPGIDTKYQVLQTKYLKDEAVNILNMCK